MPKNTNTDNKGKPYHFPVVGIGASAGGVEAIMDLFRHMPADTGMSFVYIQHLSPDFPSKLTEIIGRVTKMPVIEASQNMQIEPDHIYVITPVSDLVLENGMLTIIDRDQQGNMHMPIDRFFTSLAEDVDETSIGIILSGTATDGTVGLRAIKASGGLTIVQDETAHFQSMPKSAISEGVVDLILSPREIANELERLSKRSILLSDEVREKLEENINENNDDLKTIFHLLKKTAGIDFTHYKINTIRRRIVKRMMLHKKDLLQDYVAYLKENKSEVNLLFQDLLINVTSFFRDQANMEYLKQTLLPRMIKNKQQGDLIRIWVPACSTGEEAYSLAMLIMEVMGDKSSPNSVQIFATDLSELTITKARLGVYTRNDVANVSLQRLNRFFNKIDGSYRIAKSIRDMCVFAPHNIFKDPPFSRIDLISCCNLMIYLDNVLQKKVLSNLHYSLNPDGFLVLGKSESAGNSSDLFTPLEKKLKIYARKKMAVSRAAFDLSYRSPETFHAGKGQKNPQGKIADEGLHLEKIVDSILLDKYVPASVVVNEDLEILQFRGSTGLYLEPVPGKASLNLLKMARSSLGFELKNIVHKASKSGEPARKAGIEMKINNSAHIVTIEASPFRGDSEEKLYLIVFEQVQVATAHELKSNFSRDKMVKRLEEELKIAKEDMRSIIEEHESSNEELQSANEEIVSTNEELQSINEELETSKEELESANEELMTINAELQVRNEQLAVAYEYAEAVFTTVREAVLVLDKDLRVKSVNKAFLRIFNMNEEETEGLFLFDVADRQWDLPVIRRLLQEELPGKGQVYNIELRHVFPLVGEKMLLINACCVDHKTPRKHLYLLAIDDITEINRTQ